MSNRAVEIAGFLEQQGWGNAADTPLDADLSPRRFTRLQHDDGRRAILMDADADQKTEDFVVIDKILRGYDISAPEIFAADPMLGIVLMEDFGGRNFGRMLDSGEAPPAILYRRAVDVLIHLHRSFDKTAAQEFDLPLFGGALFAVQAEMFLDYYIPHIKNREATRDESEGFQAAWKEALKGIEALPQTLMLRDFMPDNLMNLEGRENWRSVGVLDFQDAGHGPIAYDLASLCETARRDVSDILLDEMIVYYHENAQPAISVAELKTACHILSAQRHMRILGLFVRHARKTGENGKLQDLPRIQHYVDYLLKDEKLKPLQKWIEQYRIWG